MKFFARLDKKYYFLCLAILVVALFLRLYNLTLWPVFADEAIYIRWSQIMQAEPTLRFLPLSDGKQPLFMWVLMFIVKYFSDPLFAGRLVSVFAGISTIVGSGVLSYQLFKSKKSALVTAFIMSITPFAVFFDRMALVDALLATFFVWTAVFTTSAIRSKRLDFAMIAGFFLGGALLTKSPAIFAIAVLPFSLVFLNFGKGSKVKDLIHAFGLLFATLTIGYVMYNVLRLGPNFQLVGSRNADYVFGVSHLWQNFSDPFISHLGQIWDWFGRFGPSALVLMAIVGILYLVQFNKKVLIYLLAWIAIPLMAQAEFAKVFTTRYILFTVPFVVVLASGVVTAKSKLLLKVFAAILMIFTIQAGMFDYDILMHPQAAPLPESERSGYLEEWTAGTGIKESADYLKKVHEEFRQTEIIVGTEGYFGTLPDGLAMYLQNVPNIKVIGVGLDLKELPSQLVEASKGEAKVYLAINSTRLKADPEKIGLRLVGVYPKALRTVGTREYNLYGVQEVFYLFEVMPSSVK